MKYDKTAKEVFEVWGRDYHADGMEEGHWPRVRQAFELIEACDGDYLEVGVGNGYGLAHMASHQFANGRCMGMDLSGSMVERARERTATFDNVTVEQGDFLVWDFGERHFDHIFSMEVFYYFADIDDGIAKSFTILNPGGTLWVAVNFYEENEQSADWPERLSTPMQRWSKRDYIEGLERAGFTAVGQRMISAPGPDSDVHGDEPTLLTFGTRP
jgi:ubiquinone/menaquinone biosynthesis C-methylase UbiE